MKNYIAFWPDKSFTILSASSRKELFWKLDEEGNPCSAVIYKLPVDFQIMSRAEGKMLRPLTPHDKNEKWTRVASFSKDPASIEFYNQAL